MTAAAALSGERLWKATLGELELQMTKATFNTWLRDTKLLEDSPGKMVIGVRNEYAQDWLSQRLNDTIQRTLTAIVGEPVAIEFEIVPSEPTSHHRPPDVPEPEPPPTEDSHPPKAGPGQAHITLFEVDPTRGFVAVPHYALRFWRPLIGLIPFTLWEVLRSYGYFVRQGKDEWPTIEMLVDTISYGSRATILGRAAITGDSYENKAQVGAVDVLVQYRLARHNKAGEGRSTVHYFDVLDSLPLLSPSQVEKLSKRKQAEHERFIALFKGFNVDAWQSIQAETLINDGWWK